MSRMWDGVAACCLLGRYLMLPNRVWAVIVFGVVLGASGTTFFLVSDYAKSGGFVDDVGTNMTANGNGIFMPGGPNDWQSEASGLDSGTPVPFTTCAAPA